MSPKGKCSGGGKPHRRLGRADCGTATACRSLTGPLQAPRPRGSARPRLGRRHEGRQGRRGRPSRGQLAAAATRRPRYGGRDRRRPGSVRRRRRRSAQRRVRRGDRLDPAAGRFPLAAAESARSPQEGNRACPSPTSSRPTPVACIEQSASDSRQACPPEDPSSESRSVVRVPAASAAVILLAAGRARAARGRWDHRDRGGRLRFGARWRGSGRFGGRWFGGRLCRRRFVPGGLVAIRLGRCLRRQGIAGRDRFGGEADLLAHQAAGGNRHPRRSASQAAQRDQRIVAGTLTPASRRTRPSRPS